MLYVSVDPVALADFAKDGDIEEQEESSGHDVITPCNWLPECSGCEIVGGKRNVIPERSVGYEAVRVLYAEVSVRDCEQIVQHNAMR